MLFRSRIWDKEGEAPAWQLANLTISAMVFIIGIVCVVAIIGAPLIVEVTNFGFRGVPGKFELAVSLTRVMFPFILFVSLAAAVMGMLNARFIFGIPASASTVFNIVSAIFLPREPSSRYASSACCDRARRRVPTAS